MAAPSVGDVILYEAMISSAGGSGDIRRRLLNMSVFHSLKKPYSTVQLTVQDNSGLLDSVALDGSNTFRAVFGQAPDQEPYSGEWVLTNIERARSTQNQRTAIFTATGFSPHMLNLKRVQRSFKDMPMTDAISSVVNSILSPSKPFNVRAPSRNMAGNQRMPHTINGQQVFKAIRQMMHGSASAVDTSSAYVMFEQQRALVLDTLENLMKRAGAGPTYYQRQLGTSFLNDSALAQFSIIASQEEARADAAGEAQDKTASTHMFDIFSSFIGQKGFGGGGGTASSYPSLLYNSARAPSFMQGVQAARRRMAGEFDGQAVTITVPLNPALDIGEGFNVQILAPLGDTNDPVFNKISGPLLATDLRHVVDMTRGPKGTTPQGLTSVRGSKGNIAYV